VSISEAARARFAAGGSAVRERRPTIAREEWPHRPLRLRQTKGNNRVFFDNPTPLQLHSTTQKRRC